MIEVNAMGATLDLFTEVGIDTIYEEATRLADRLREGIKTIGGDLFCTTGPIVNFKMRRAEEQKDVEARFNSARVAYAKRGPGIRLSPHAYNKDEEIDLVLNLIK